MKKDIEWLREEIYALYPSSYRAYVLKEPDMLLKTEIIDKIIELIDQLEEPTKPVIPKFVADYIELNKDWSEDRQEYAEDDNSGLWFALNGDNQGMPNSVSDWLFNEEKVETFARSWLDGYEVDKEPHWVIEKGGNYIKTYLIDSNKVVNIDYEPEKEDSLTFLSREEAEAIALLIGGEVEEVLQ